MQVNRILAGLLVVACLFSAVVAFQRPATVRPSSESVVTQTGLGGDRLRVRGDRIAVVSLAGPIAAEIGGVSPTSSLTGRLRELAKDDNVKGVLLQINSPGGTVGASQELYRGILALRQTKPVIATVADLAASGGYYAASAADEIVANPGSLVGNIGVLIQGFNASELLNKIGVAPETIKTGPFKDILSPAQPLSEEGRKLLQGLVDNSFEQFIAAVAEGRQRLPDNASEVLPESAIARREGLSVDRVRQLADGRVFTGQQALEVGLVDELGGYDEAVANLRTWIGSPDIPVSSDLQGFDRFWKILQSRFSLPPLPAGAAGGIENLVRSNSATDATLAGANLLGLPLWLSPPLQLQAELHL